LNNFGAEVLGKCAIFRNFAALEATMNEITTYNCERINSQRLFIADLNEFLGEDESYMHFIKGTLLCFCRRGHARIMVNYSEYHMNGNDLLAILPTHMFTIEDCSDDLQLEAVLYSDEYWASISHSVDYELIKLVEYHPYSIIAPEHRNEVFTLLDLVKKHDAAGGDDMVQHSVAGGLAFSLLMLMASFISKDNFEANPHLNTRKEILTHDFFTLLSQHYETERQVAFYASKLCVTPKHLSTMVKEVTHWPIQEWINNVTLLNIKHRLLTTTDTIQLISEDMNFQTPSTFVRYFRQHTGSTPSKFRAEHCKTSKE
jgi:AraC-like DNA-binding protein